MPAVSSGNRRRWAAAAAAVAIAAVAPYAGTVRGEFVFDDNPEVVDNEAIRSLSHLPALFGEPAWKGSGEDNPIYRPLTTATYALNHAVGGLSPGGYHLVNVALHALAALAVLALAAALGLPLGAAAFTAALFAVHPIHVEAVANVAGRKDLLATVFLVAAVLAHRRALRGGGAWAVAAPLALAGALFSKETGLIGIGLLAAHDLLFGREAWARARRRGLVLYAVYLGEVAGYLLARRAAVGSFGVPLAAIPYAENPIAYVPAGTRILTALSVLGRGLGLLVAPVHQSPDYSFAALPPSTSVADPWLVLALVAFLAWAAVAALRWRREPVWAFSLGWYGAGILPAANLLVAVGTIFGERLLYLPSVGFCLVVGVFAGKVLDVRPGQATAREVLRWSAAALVLVLLGWRAASYAGVWENELTLFTYGVEAQPRSVKMRQCLGAALMERGRPAEAVPQLEAALDIAHAQPTPPASRHRLELGVGYEALGRLDDAAAVYRQILADDPSYADALWRLGVVQWAAGRRGEAVASWQRTIAVDPRHGRAMSDLGIAAAAAGDGGAARGWWERAVAADPRLASAWYRLGNAYERAGDLARARQAWGEFLRHAGAKLPREQAEVEAKLGGASPVAR